MTNPVGTEREETWNMVSLNVDDEKERTKTISKFPGNRVCGESNN